VKSVLDVVTEKEILLHAKGAQVNGHSFAAATTYLLYT
jgi:hypothetical protein